MRRHIVSVDWLKDGRVLVQPYSCTTNGFDIGDGLPHVLMGNTDAAELGEVVVQALHESNRRPLPARNLRTDPPERELLAWMGLKTVGQYMKGTRGVSLYAVYDSEITTVRILPQRNGGARGAFTGIKEERVVLDYESPEQLGRAVQDALQKATA